MIIEKSAMKIVGLTGGIGSGKTTVAKMFMALGVPVYIADLEAKKILETDVGVVGKVTKLLGGKAYKGGKPDRAYIASRVFSDRELLEQLNNIIHPEVGRHFRAWIERQEGLYVIKEAAILFENDGYKKCDKTILVTAPEKLRIKRVTERDNVLIADVEARINNQWTDDKKITLANEIIYNTGSLEDTQRQVEAIHAKFLQTF